VAKPELGTKRTCPTTGRKFYDLNRTPPVSPYTGQVVMLARAEFARGSARPSDEEETETDVADVELVSLDDVAAEEADKDVIIGDDIDLGDDDSADDTFLEEEEEGDDDVSVLIDGEIDTDEES
jgi:uncharacterized protein (TIGR02300 family)